MARDKNNGFNPRVILCKEHKPLVGALADIGRIHPPEEDKNVFEEIIYLRPTRAHRGEGKRLTPAQKIEMVFMMAKSIDAADERRRCSGSEKND